MFALNISRLFKNGWSIKFAQPISIEPMVRLKAAEIKEIRRGRQRLVEPTEVVSKTRTDTKLNLKPTESQTEDTTCSHECAKVRDVFCCCNYCVREWNK